MLVCLVVVLVKINSAFCMISILGLVIVQMYGNQGARSICFDFRREKVDEHI